MTAPVLARLTGACLLSLVVAIPLAAQNLARRVDGAPDGVVQFSFASREGVCGNGRTFISTGDGSWYGSFMNDQTTREQCQRGPVRVVLNRAGREVVDLDVFVGPPAVAAGATDLGTVPAREAADYLLGIAARVDGKPGRDAILPALLADSAAVGRPLLAIARDAARPRETRRTAMSWLVRAVDNRADIPTADVVKALGDVARDENDNQSVRQSALGSLSRFDRGDGIPALIEISRGTSDVWLGRQALSALAQSGDPRARVHLRSVVQRSDLPEDMRVAAIRGIGNNYATSSDGEFLRGLYPRLDSDKAKDALLNTVAEIGGSTNARWIMDVARRNDESLPTRRRAVQLLDRAGTPVADMIKLFDQVDDQQMKEAVLNALVQNGTRAATDKVLEIAKSDNSYALRRRAISALGRSDDPRVKEALKQMIERQ
jgi:hypothetical protein